MQTQTQTQQRQPLNLQSPPVELSANEERLALVMNALQTLQTLDTTGQPTALQHLYPQPQPRHQIYIDPWAARGFVGVCGLGVVMIGAVAILNSLPNAQQQAATRELLQQQQAAMEAIANRPQSNVCVALICPDPPAPAAPPSQPMPVNHLPPYNEGQY